MKYIILLLLSLLASVTFAEEILCPIKDAKKSLFDKSCPTCNEGEGDSNEVINFLPDEIKDTNSNSSETTKGTSHAKEN